MKGLLVLPLYFGLVAVFQSATTTNDFWLGQGLAVAILAAVGSFFGFQIWPEVKKFFASLLLKTDNQSETIVALKNEYINSSHATATAATAAQTAATAASTSATAASAAATALLAKMDEHQAVTYEIKAELAMMRENYQKQNDAFISVIEKNTAEAKLNRETYEHYMKMQGVKNE